MKRVWKRSLGWALLLVFAVLESGPQPAVAGRLRRRCCDAGQAAAPAAKTSPQTIAEPAPKPAWEAPAQINPSPAPFVLTPQQQTAVDEFLKRWEKRSAMVRTLRCKFTQWEYLPRLRQSSQDEAAVDWPRFERNGRLTCAGQQQWVLFVNDVRRIDPQTGKTEVDPHAYLDYARRIDGKTQILDDKKQMLVEPTSPVYLFGLTPGNESPLPLLYGIKAAQLKQRYFLRLITPDDFKQDEVWIDAFPRDKREGACRLIVRLKKDNLDPYAMRIYDQNGGFRSYEFEDLEVNASNDKIRNDLFPRTLCIWKSITERPATIKAK